MRQRKVKNIDEKLAAFEGLLVTSPAEFKGHWAEAFGNDQPIYLELGCGKGQFITTYARENSDKNYVAVEGQDSVILRALEKCVGVIANALFFCDFVQDIRDYFGAGELAGVYLNFSDPWPKKRHAKRRLTYGGRLLTYMDVLAPGGCIEIKTDNDGLFEFTLDEIERVGIKIEAMTRDLHKSGKVCLANGEVAVRNEGGTWSGIDGGELLDEKAVTLAGVNEEACASAAKITTEYEDKFRGGGKNINFVRIRK